MEDANTAALHDHMCEQDHADKIMELCGEQARQLIEDDYYMRFCDDIFEVVVNDPEEVSTVLTDKWRAMTAERDACAIGEAFLQLMDTACSQMVTQDRVAEKAHELAKEQ